MHSSSGVKILGIDPGLQRTGWGLILINGNSLKYLAHGVISTDTKDPISLRIKNIYGEIYQILERQMPQEIAIEEIFLNNNPNSTLKLGMARGASMLACANFGLEVNEYSANKVKKAVCGSGHADKTQIQTMVRMLLPNAPSAILADAADALAVAICHGNHRSLTTRISAC